MKANKMYSMQQTKEKEKPLLCDGGWSLGDKE